MSKPSRIVIHPTKNVYIDRSVEENEKFPELNINVKTIDTILLLLKSEEDTVLINILKHITEYIRRNDDNIKLLKEKNVLELMLPLEFYRLNANFMVRRFSLYITAAIIENMNCLLDLETPKTLEIIKICLEYYKGDDDDFCLEYLSVVINKCLDDPQVVRVALFDDIFVEKYFKTLTMTSNPDVIFHSFEILEKMLFVQCLEEVQDFFALPTFPTSRVLCELTSEFLEIRRAALKVLRILILDTGEKSPFIDKGRIKFVLEQLTKMFCENLMAEEMHIVVDVLAAAMRNEDMAFKFFELNLFEKYLNHINDGTMEFLAICKALLVLSESAKYAKFLPRLIGAETTEKMLNCLLNDNDIPATHIVSGLNRLMKSTDGCNRIIEAYDQALLPKLLKLLPNVEAQIKTREQVADLLNNLLSYAFHQTAKELLDLRLPAILAEIFGQDREMQSIDLLLSLLSIIETMAGNTDYREEISETGLMIINLGMLLTKSFSTSILVNNIFRCLCTIVDEESVRIGLLNTFICPSIKRALVSVSSVLKMSVTNFIMQTTRFPEFVKDYIDAGVLEVLIMNQQHAFCVPTWNPAIDSILSKSTTYKFCIRNNLDFTDITIGQDFLVSKKKFDDFRLFHKILKEEVSPLEPILIVNFDRPETPNSLIVKIPTASLLPEDFKRFGELDEWCYCRTPGDECLPKHLEEVNSLLEAEGLAVNPVKMKRCIDFDNVARRAKIIAQVVARVMGDNLKCLDINSGEECAQHTVKCHLKELAIKLHSTFIPLGRVQSGCQFERAVLFKTLADQVGLPCTLQRSVDGRLLFNELPLPVVVEQDVHCDKQSMQYMPWRLLRPTHIVDLMYNVGDLYPVQSRQALQYLRLY